MSLKINSKTTPATSNAEQKAANMSSLSDIEQNTQKTFEQAFEKRSTQDNHGSLGSKKTLEENNKFGADTGKNQDADLDSEQPAQAMSPQGMSSLMSDLFSSRFEIKTENVGQNIVNSADLEDLVASLTDRILVSEKDIAGNSQVRITLNDKSLAQTEIVLTRSSDGLLNVTFVSENQNSFQSLVAAQHQLQASLDKLENNNVRITIESSNSNAGAGDDANDSSRRSRNFQEYNKPDDE